MLSSVGLEVTDSINPQFNWKIVTKGRRTRTSAARRKLTAAVSGQTEHVPIKKRRHLLRSPSPQPQTPLNCHQDSSSQLYSSPPPFEDDYAYSSHFSAPRSTGADRKLRDGSGVIKFGEGFGHEVVSEQVGGEHNYVGDFSGIELLAAAASMDDDADYTCKQELVVGDSLIPKNSDISNLATQFKQDSECNKSSSIKVVLEDDTDCSLVSNNLKSAAQSLLGCVGGVTMPRTYSLKVDRTHWDLNTLMDAWDEPYNDTVAGKTLKDVACNDMHVEGRQGDVEHQILCNPSITEDKFSDLEIKEDKLLAVSPCGTCIVSSTPKETLTEPTNICNPSITEDKFSDLEIKEDKLLAVSPCGTCIVSSTPKETLTEPTNICYSNVTTKMSDLVTEKNTDYPSTSVENIDSPAASVQKIVSPASSVSKTNLHIAFVGNMDLKGALAEKIGSYPPFADKVDLRTTSAERVDLCVTYAEKVDSNAASAEKIDSYAASAEKIDQYTVSAGKTDSHIASAVKIDSTVDSQIYSDVCLDNRGHGVDMDNMARFQEGHDSPYEDGELRWSFLYPWEENELENKNVDYESDGRHGDSSDAGSLGSVRKSLLTKTFLGRNESNGISVKHSYMHLIEDESKNDDYGGKNESDVNLFIGENDNERRFSDHTDAINETVAHMDECLLRTIQGKVQSCNKGRSSLDAFSGKDIFFLQQCRSRRLGGSDSNPERRDMGPYKYLSRYRHATHGSEKGGGYQWRYWSSKGRSTSSYQGVEGRNLNRRGRITGDFVDKFGRVYFDQKRQNPNYLSEGYLHRHEARSSPVDRDDGFGVRRRTPLTFGIKGNYLLGVGKKYGNRPDKASNSVRLSPYLSTRERSFSPSSGRGVQIPLMRRSSRSRSRTSSPTAWNSHKGREMDTRRHIRSPDFRSEARMDRMKFLNSSPAFTSDHHEGYLSPPRGRFSPQRNGQWFDDLDFADNNLRRRRSPVRLFRRSRKLDATGTSGRLKSDNYFKPTIRSGRFSVLANDGREGKFETDYGHRRRYNRGEVMHRRRDADDGGNLRRFRQFAEADVETNLNNMDDDRVTDSRNVPQK